MNSNRKWHFVKFPSQSMLFLDTNSRWSVGNRSVVVVIVSLISYMAFAAGTISEDHEGEASMLHMWASRSEQAALAVLSSRMRDRNLKWLDYSVSGNMAGIEQELMARIVNDTQPSMVQWIIDDKMRSLVRGGIFRLIDDKNNYFANHLHPSVAEIVLKGDQLTGLPLNLHVQNHIVYNNDVLEMHNLDVPDSWEELISYGEILKKSNVNLLGVSDQPWQLRKLYLSILSSYLTPTEFDEIQVNFTNLDHMKEKLHKAMKILSALKTFSNTDQHDMRWNDVSRKVANGQALAQVLGDYIIPEFPADANITCALPPNHQYIYWGSDSIAFINNNNPSEILAQQYMVELVSDPAVMAEFVYKKGGIPVTSNIKQSDIHPCMRNIVVEWNKSKNTIWVGGDAWRNQFVAIGEFLSKEWKKPVFELDTAVDRLLRVLEVL